MKFKDIINEENDYKFKVNIWYKRSENSTFPNGTKYKCKYFKDKESFKNWYEKNKDKIKQYSIDKGKINEI